MDEREVHELLRGAADNVQPSPDLPGRAERRYRSRRVRGRVVASAFVIALVVSGVATAQMAGSDHRSGVVAPTSTSTPKFGPVNVTTFGSLAFVDANTGYGVATAGGRTVLAKTRDGARTWHTVAAMPPEIWSVAVVSQAHHDPVQLVAWGNGDLYETTDDGAHWNRTFRHVENVAVSPGRIWATTRCDPGEQCTNKVMTSDDLGSSWRGVTQFRSIGAVAASARLTDVAFAVVLAETKATHWEIARSKEETLWAVEPTPCPSDSGPLLAVGGDGVSLMLVCKRDDRDHVFVSPNQGRTWTETVALPSRGRVGSVSPSNDSSSTFVVGLRTAVGPGWAKGPLRYPVLDQWEWKAKPQPIGDVLSFAPVPEQGAGMFFAAATGVWFDHDGTRELRTAPPTPTPAISGAVDVGNIGSVSFIDADEGYGIEWAGSGGDRYLVHSIDGARTWARVAGLPEGVETVTFAPEYAKGADGLVAWGVNGLWQSSDHGAHWAQTLDGSVAVVTEASFRLWASVVCGAGSPASCMPRLVTSTDAGRTWTDPEAPIDLKRGATGLAVPATSMYLVDGEFAWSPNGGRAWAKHPEPPECATRPRQTLAINVTELLLVCSSSTDGSLAPLGFVSADYGKTWQATAAIPRPAGVYPEIVMAIDSGFLLAISDGPLLVTTDDGQSWRDVYATPDLSTVVALSQTFGVGYWIAAADSGIWFSADGEHWERRAAAGPPPKDVGGCFKVSKSQTKPGFVECDTPTPSEIPPRVRALSNLSWPPSVPANPTTTTATP